MPTTTDASFDRAVSIVALFSAFVHAWRTNDFRTAADTQAELERLGIRVAVVRPQETRH